MCINWLWVYDGDRLFKKKKSTKILSDKKKSNFLIFICQQTSVLIFLKKIVAVSFNPKCCTSLRGCHIPFTLMKQLVFFCLRFITGLTSKKIKIYKKRIYIYKVKIRLKHSAFTKLIKNVFIYPPSLAWRFAEDIILRSCAFVACVCVCVCVSVCRSFFLLLFR